jgi:hypothetical protein
MQLPPKPRSVATSQLGVALPCPHPPSPLVWATTGPAHLPVLKAQQPCWQSESEEQDSKTVSLEDWSPEPPPDPDDEEEEDPEAPSVDLDLCFLDFLPESSPGPSFESLSTLAGGAEGGGEEEDDEPPSGKGMLSNWEVNLAAAITPGLDSAARAPDIHTPRLRAVATSQLGCDWPNPHPPTPLVWAMPGPAHLPVSKAQQPC